MVNSRLKAAPTVNDYGSQSCKPLTPYLDGAGSAWFPISIAKIRFFEAKNQGFAYCAFFHFVNINILASEKNNNYLYLCKTEGCSV